MCNALFHFSRIRWYVQLNKDVVFFKINCSQNLYFLNFLTKNKASNNLTEYGKITDLKLKLGEALRQYMISNFLNFYNGPNI